MNHHTASSTLSPTVSRPWLRKIAALASPSAVAIRMPSSSREHDARVVVEQRVIVVERARVLGDADRASRPSEDHALPCIEWQWAADDHVGTGQVDVRVDRERGPVHDLVALDDLAVVVHEHQVGHADHAEVHGRTG